MTQLLKKERIRTRSKGNNDQPSFADAVDDLQKVLSGIPDRPSLKLMTFDELKKKPALKQKDPSKRQHTYKALKNKIDAVQTALGMATLQGVKDKGGADKFQQDFNKNLDDLTSALTKYQKHHKGKKSTAVNPLKTEIEDLRKKLPEILKSLETAKDERFKESTSIENVADLKSVEPALQAALGKTTFSTATMSELATEKGRAAVLEKMNAELNELEQIASSGKLQRAGGNVKTGPDLLAEIGNLRTSLEETLRGVEKYANLPDAANLRIADAAALLKGNIKPEQLKGVSLKHCNFAEFNSGTEVPPPKKIAGTGACNQVQRINYIDGTRYFKEEKTHDRWGQAEAIKDLGIDKENPRYGNRNVASSIMSDLLGSQVVVKSTFALSTNTDKDPAVGLLMESATGKSMSNKQSIRPVLRKLSNQLEEELKGIREQNKGKPQQEVDRLEESHREAFIKKAVADNFPSTEPLSPKAQASLQKQLMELEINDLLSGQVDRHLQNYFVDVKGDEVTVKGIDNDFAFGKNNKGGVPLDCGQHNVANLPVLMDREMAAKLKSLNFDKDVAPNFGELLDQEQIAAAKERFVALQNHVTELEKNGRIVDDWETFEKDGQSATQILTQPVPVVRNGKQGVSDQPSLFYKHQKSMEYQNVVIEYFKEGLEFPEDI